MEDVEEKEFANILLQLPRSEIIKLCSSNTKLRSKCINLSDYYWSLLFHKDLNIISGLNIDQYNRLFYPLIPRQYLYELYLNPPKLPKTRRIVADRRIALIKDEGGRLEIYNDEGILIDNVEAPLSNNSINTKFIDLGNTEFFLFE